MPTRLRDLLTVPNQLTVVRLSLLPFLIIAIRYRRYDWALGLLLAAAASDALDGMLARRMGQRTAVGAYLDPIADKLLLSSSFLVLALEGRLPWWLTILVLGRDVLMLVVSAVILLVVGYVALPPSVWGKLTTGAQVALVFVVILEAVGRHPVLGHLAGVGTHLVAALTVISGLHYSLAVTRRLTHSVR
jgi:cardiolipin synthase